MFKQNLVIIDVETTGLSSAHNKIIELGIIRVEKGKIVGKLNTLINPQAYVSPFIEKYTGISKEELKTAPIFNDVKNQVKDILSDAIFVAHNARFDYGFIKHEFSRLENTFSAKTLCTVRLSRRLFPEHRSHSLQSLIDRYQFKFKRRHRAYDDANIVLQFLKIINKQIKPNKLNKIFSDIII